MVYTGQRWQIDDGNVVDAVIRACANEMFIEADALSEEMTGRDAAELVRFVKSINSARGVAAIRSLLPSDPGISIAVDALDRFPRLFNTQTGVVDLRSGELLKHDPARLLSKLSPVEFDSAAICPLWEQVLADVFQVPDLVEHFQRVCGYWLTASVREHKLFILWGCGANGKSTVIETILALLGEYGTIGAPDLLMQKGDTHPTEVASLYGHRLVVCTETDEGRRLAEARVKLLTGGDTLTARRMREDFWTFAPTHKLVVCTNHKPQLRGTDLGIRRRLHLIPFLRTFTPEQQDKQLGAKLRGELSGILNWAIQGAMRWQAEGLGEPAAVRDATAEYVSSQDTFGRFIEEACSLVSWQKVRASHLYAAYRTWSEASGEVPVSMRRLAQSIEERGFTKRVSNGAWYEGIGLKAEGLE